MGGSPTPLKPTFEKHLDAVNWMIGLPVAALFGTAQFVEKIDFIKHPYAGNLLMWIVVVNAAAAVVSVWYYFVAIHMADLKILGKTPTKGHQRRGCRGRGLLRTRILAPGHRVFSDGCGIGELPLGAGGEDASNLNACHRPAAL